MKKIISLLTAAVTALSISAAAFAADDTPGLETPGITGIEARTAMPITPRIGLTGINDEITINPGELFLVQRDTGIIAGVYNHLVPDQEYTFRVYHYSGAVALTAADDAAVLADTNVKEITGQMLNGGAVRLRTKKGSNYISGARVKSTGRGDATVYDVVITTRAQYGTTLSDVEYILSVTGYKTPETNPLTFKESQHSFEVGWPTIDDDETDVGEDGVIVITNDAPVITKAQFADISRSANYKTVNFEGEDGGWAFTGRTSGMGSSNFFFNYDVVPEIINKFPDQDYKFLTFRGGVTFPANGEMRIDVSDLTGEFNNIYTYLYRNGRLTRVATTYDSDTSEIVFRTNYLGSFMITSEEITDTSIIAEENNNNNNNNEPDETDEDDKLPSGTENPHTGASGILDLGAALGLVTLVTAGVISRKRK